MKTKRLLSLLLAVLLCFGSVSLLASCSKPAQKPLPDKTKVTCVYRPTDIPLPEGLTYINLLCVTDGRIYFNGEKDGQNEDGTYWYESLTYSMKLDGSDVREIRRPWAGDSGYVGQTAVASDGTLWFYYSEYLYEGEDPYPVVTDPLIEAIPVTFNDLDSEAMQKSSGESVIRAASPESVEDGGFVETIMIDEPEPFYSYVNNEYLIHTDANGEILGEKVDLKPISEELGLEYVSVSNMLTVGTDIFFEMNGHMVAIDANGNKKFTADLGVDWTKGLFLDGKTNQIVFSYYANEDWETLHTKTLDPQTGRVSENELPAITGFAANYSYNMISGPDHSFYFNTNTGIYAYDYDTSKTTELMNYINSDVEMESYNFSVLSEDSFLSSGVRYDESDRNPGFRYAVDEVAAAAVAPISSVVAPTNYGPYLERYDRIPDDEITPKYVLTLSLGDYMSGDLKEQIFKFNRSNEEYRIQVVDYSILSDADTSGGVRLNADLIAGNIPDILLVSDEMDFETFEDKGLFLDFYELIDNDPAFNRSDFLENVFKANEFKGKLYEMVPSFSLTSMAGKKEIVGDRTGWTVDEFLSVVNGFSEETTLLGDTYNRAEFLEMAIAFLGSELVDFKNGVCHFDSDDFKKILTYSAQLPEKTIWERGDEIPETYWEDFENQYKDNRVALYNVYISNFGNLWNELIWSFGNDAEVTLVGLPNAGKSPALMIGNNIRFAISSNCALVDGAWQFVSSFLTEEYQDSFSYGFPIRRSSLDKRIEAAKTPVEPDLEKNPWMENYVILDNTEFSKDQPIMTPEFVDQIASIVTSVDKVSRIDTDLMEIVNSEIAAFYSGAKSVDETVKVIQSKAQIYINE